MTWTCNQCTLAHNSNIRQSCRACGAKRQRKRDDVSDLSYNPVHTLAMYVPLSPSFYNFTPTQPTQPGKEDSSSLHPQNSQTKNGPILRHNPRHDIKIRVRYVENSSSYQNKSFFPVVMCFIVSVFDRSSASFELRNVPVRSVGNKIVRYCTYTNTSPIENLFLHIYRSKETVLRGCENLS